MADSEGVISAVSQSVVPAPRLGHTGSHGQCPGRPCSALYTLSLNSQKYVIADPSLAGNSNMRQHETLFSEYLIQRNVSQTVLPSFASLTVQPEPGSESVLPGSPALVLGRGSWLPDTAQVHTNIHQPPPPPAHSILNTNCQKLVVKLSKRLW